MLIHTVSQETRWPHCTVTNLHGSCEDPIPIVQATALARSITLEAPVNQRTLLASTFPSYILTPTPRETLSQVFSTQQKKQVLQNTSLAEDAS